MFAAERVYEAQETNALNGTASLDMATLLMSAYDLGDSINQSVEVAEYLYWKRVVFEDAQVKEVSKKFEKAKEFFAECERFGRFHPDYHSAKDKVKQIERELGAIESVSKFKASELAVDQMLHDIATLIAGSVSANIKVPSNEKKLGGCGSGGSCSCGSGGCG